ncbi:MAG: hypothetical protein U0793_34025 [Gemmataceae bacterium]
MGAVQADDPSGVSVSLGGAVNAVFGVDAQGHFDAVYTADHLGLINAFAYNADGASPAASAALSDPSPSLSLSVTENGGRSVTLSGLVTDDAPGGATVNFSGPVWGSVITNADGSFSYTADAMFLGSVQATATDAWWQTSSPVQVTLSNPAPTLTLNVVAGPGRTVTLSGVLSDDGAVAGRTVSFFGPVVGSTITASDGSFSFTTQAMSLGTVQATATDDWGQMGLATAPIPNQAPVLTLQINHGAGRTVTLSGDVSDESPGGNTVFFSGAVAGSVVTDPSGHFSYTTDALYLGTVQAMTSDVWGQMSNMAQVNVASSAPTLTLQVAYGAGRMVTLSGVVSDESPGGQLVSFSGMVVGSTLTNPDGSFSFTAQASALGSVAARTVDAWGLLSDPGAVTLTSDAPVIETFTVAYNADHYVTLQGRVTDESLDGLLVQFSGAVLSIAGKTAAIDAVTGVFTLTLQLQPDESGGVGAMVTDWWGLASNLATLVIYS